MLTAPTPFDPMGRRDEASLNAVVIDQHFQPSLLLGGMGTKIFTASSSAITPTKRFVSMKGYATVDECLQHVHYGNDTTQEAHHVPRRPASLFDDAA